MGTTPDYTSTFEKSFEHVVGLEGRYSNHPKDLGGPTKYGVTEKLARQYGYDGPMFHMPLTEAKRIYWQAFWEPMGLRTIERLAPKLAERLFDMGVNVGSGRAIMWLQICLNSFNVQEAKYADIAEDGVWGDKTRGALETFLTWRMPGGESALCKAVTCLQGHHYIDISRRRPDNEEFVYGWITNRIKL